MEKKKRFLISATYYLIIAAVVFVLLKYVLGAVMPFVIGFAIAAMMNPLVRFLSRKYRMKYRASAVFVLLAAYATVGTLTAVGVVRLAVWLGDFSGRLPELYRESVEPALGRAYEWISALVSRFDSEASDDVVGGIGGLFESVTSSLGTAVSDISVRALAFLSGAAAAIPKVIISLGFAVISSFFFLVDFEKILSEAKARLPKKAVGFMSGLRDKFFVTMVKYLRSYALIMLITFALLFFGLAVIGTENALMLALIIAALDVLPVIGTGFVMIPWAVISMLGKHVRYGIGLLAVWVVITVIRNIIEPRIVGRQVGLHPLVTLIAMFVGTKLFGFAGLIILPVGLSIAASVIRERDQLSEPK